MLGLVIQHDPHRQARTSGRHLCVCVCVFGQAGTDHSLAERPG